MQLANKSDESSHNVQDFQLQHDNIILPVTPLSVHTGQLMARVPATATLNYETIRVNTLHVVED